MATVSRSHERSLGDLGRKRPASDASSFHGRVFPNGPDIPDPRPHWKCPTGSPRTGEQEDSIGDEAPGPPLITLMGSEEASPPFLDAEERGERSHVLYPSQR